MRDGVKLHTVILVPKGAKRRADPAHAHALRRQQAHQPRRERAPRPGPERLRQRDGRDRRGRLHPRRPGRARQARLRGRLRHEPAAARAAEPDARRPRDRHLRHHRLAGEERPREQRQGRHPRDLLRRLPAPDGARQPAPGAQGVGADEPDGRRLDGRRLVPQRRLPPAEHALHLRAGGDARRTTRSGGRATSTTTTCSCRRARPASWGGAGASSRSGFWQKLLEHPAYDAFWRDQAVDKLLAARAAEGAGDAGPQPLGPGGHLRRHRRLQGDRAEGHGQRQGLPGHGPLAPRPGDRGRQLAGRAEVRQRHGALLPPRRSCARSSTST